MIKTILLILMMSIMAAGQQLQVLEDTDSLKARREKTNANFNLLNDRISDNSVLAHGHPNKSVLDALPSALGTGNRFLAMNAAGTAFEFKQFVAGNGISISFSAGSITISATGGTGINSLNGLVGASQLFANDTNIVVNSSGSTHTFGWNGQLAPGRGGTGSAFFNVVGPSGTVKTFTFPNQSAAVLTDAAPVSVAQGGTGASSLSGILKGNGTSPITAVSAPSGAIVGTTDNQQLSGKELISPEISGSATYKNQAEARYGDSDNSNYVAVRAPATVPANKVFTLPATDGTPNQAIVTDGNGNWSFATMPGASGGEANTASNQGAGGVGLFKQKSGVDLQFRNVNAASSKISVALDAANNEVDVDVAEAQLNLNNIGGTLGAGKGGLGAANLNGIIRGNGASPATAIPAPVGALVGTTDPQTLEGKSIDVEASGNNIKTVSTIWLDGAGCNGNSPSPNWDLPTSNAPVATCEPLGNTHKGLLDFADGGTDLTAQRMIALPSDWTGAVDVKARWQSAITTGNVVIGVSTSCTNDGEADNQTWGTYSEVTDATKGTASQLNLATVSNINTSGCAAGELMHIRIARRLSQAADTMAGTLRLVGVEIILRRNQ